MRLLVLLGLVLAVVHGGNTAIPVKIKKFADIAGACDGPILTRTKGRPFPGTVYTEHADDKPYVEVVRINPLANPTDVTVLFTIPTALKGPNGEDVVMKYVGDNAAVNPVDGIAYAMGQIEVGFHVTNRRHSNDAMVIFRFDDENIALVYGNAYYYPGRFNHGIIEYGMFATNGAGSATFTKKGQYVTSHTDSQQKGIVWIDRIAELPGYAYKDVKFWDDADPYYNAKLSWANATEQLPMVFCRDALTSTAGYRYKANAETPFLWNLNLDDLNKTGIDRFAGGKPGAFYCTPAQPGYPGTLWAEPTRAAILYDWATVTDPVSGKE